jgi:molecular chaperone DnaJ
MYGEGEHGMAGGPPATSTSSSTQEHEFFRRDGNDLICEVPVNYPTLALGGEIRVPTLDGDQTIKIAEGTETGSTMRLKGKGMPDVAGRGRGDLFVTVKVITPRKLTKEQRQAIEQLKKTLPKESFTPTQREEADEKNLFDRVKDIFG